MIQRYLLTIALILISVCLRAQNEAYAPADGTSIRYLSFGEGDPVLIINGGPGFNCEGFQPLAKEIAAMGYQAILFDQRGTGKSTLDRSDSSTITLDLMAQDIEAIRSHLHIERWVVLGHSFGGMMGSYYTAKHPDRVSALVLSSSGGLDLALLNDAGASLFAQLKPEEVDSLHYWRSRFDETGNAQDRRNQLKYLSRAYVFHKEHAPLIAERLQEGDLDLNQMVWSDMRRINYDVKDELAKFDGPVLIIQGMQDVVARSLAVTADSVFKASTLVFLDSCGHYGWVDQNEKYFDQIRSFLGSVR